MLAVGRRLGGAVVRNRLKRRLRHLCRELAVQGAVVVARPGAALASFAALRHELAHLNDMG